MFLAMVPSAVVGEGCPLVKRIDLVVVHKDLDIDVPPDSGHEVIAALAVAVAVPGRDDHRHGVVREPDAVAAGSVLPWSPLKVLHFV